MDKKWYTISELAKDSDISIPGTMKALGYLVEREFLEQRFESGNLSDNGISARVRHEFLLNEEGTRYAEQSLQYYSDCESYETLKRSKRKAAFA